MSLQHYSILLILTDGVINDMQKTIARSVVCRFPKDALLYDPQLTVPWIALVLEYHSIVEVSRKPLSIIIVGVGAADFKQMEFLDADKEALTANGQRAKVRDKPRVSVNAPRTTCAPMLVGGLCVRCDLMVLV